MGPDTGKFLFSIVNAQRMHSAPGAMLPADEQVSEEATSTVSLVRLYTKNSVRYCED